MNDGETAAAAAGQREWTVREARRYQAVIDLETKLAIATIEVCPAGHAGRQLA